MPWIAKIEGLLHVCLGICMHPLSASMWACQITLVLPEYSMASYFLRATSPDGYGCPAECVNSRTVLPGMAVTRTLVPQNGGSPEHRRGQPVTTNKNVEWINAPGAWTFIIALITLGWLLACLFVDSGLAWTYVHLGHGLITYYLLHWNKGSPIQMDQVTLLERPPAPDMLLLSTSLCLGHPRADPNKLQPFHCRCRRALGLHVSEQQVSGTDRCPHLRSS